MLDFETQAQQTTGAAPREESARDALDDLEREHEELVAALQRELGLTA